MKKTFIAALVAAGLLTAGITAAAETSPAFSYYRDGDDIAVTFSDITGDSNKGKSELVLGFYDNGTLVKSRVVKFDSSEKVDADTVRTAMPDIAGELTVKAFWWTEDKLEPLMEQQNAEHEVSLDSVAIIKKSNELRKVSGNVYGSYTALIGNSEVVVSQINDWDMPQEGSVVAYENNDEGLTEDSWVLLELPETYEELQQVAAQAAYRTIFNMSHFEWITDAEGNGAAAIAYNHVKPENPAYAYFGAVESCSDGVIALDMGYDGKKSFEVGSALTYIYDYGKRSGMRLSQGDLADIPSSGAYAFVRELNGAAKEIVVYLSSETQTAQTAQEVIIEDDNFVEVYPNSDTTELTAYDDNSKKIKYVIDGNAEYYVNNSGIYDFDSVTMYFDTAKRIKLIDEDLNGIIEAVYLDCGETFVVDNVATTSDAVKIYAKSGFPARIRWDKQDPTVEFKITLDGREIDYTELKENDVLTVWYDVAGGENLNGDFTYAEAAVSRNTVDGMITACDLKQNTIHVNDTDYQVDRDHIDAANLSMDTETRFFRDIYGEIVWHEDLSRDVNYGVLLSAYTINENYVIKFAASDGTIDEYQCKDRDSNIAIADILSNAVDADGDGVYSTEELKPTIEYGVFEYVIVNGKVKISPYPSMPKGGNEIEYREVSKKIGSYTVNDNMTKILNIEAYLKGESDTIDAMSVSDLQDSYLYDAYLYDKSSELYFRFVLITGVHAPEPEATKEPSDPFEDDRTLNPACSLSVVKKIGVAVTEDGQTYIPVTVCRKGDELEIQIAGESCDFHKGDVIAYVQGESQYLNQEDIVRVFSLQAEDYQTLKADTIGHRDFNEMLNAQCIGEADGREGRKLEFGAETDKDVRGYFGIVYQTSSFSFDIFTDKNQNDNQTAQFTVDLNNIPVVIYQYDNLANHASSIDIEAYIPAQNRSTFNQFYADEEEMHIDWDSVSASDWCNPHLVFVRTINDDVTDVVVYRD